MSVFHKCWKTTARKKNILKNQTVKQETGYFDDLKENPLFFFLTIISKMNFISYSSSVLSKCLLDFFFPLSVKCVFLRANHTHPREALLKN